VLRGGSRASAGQSAFGKAQAVGPLLLIFAVAILYPLMRIYFGDEAGR
jgi:hypothetical protein